MLESMTLTVGGECEMTAKLEYRAKIDALVRNTLDEMQCQPILFVGSGLSRRYSNLPSWVGLLANIATEVGMNEAEFSYLVQKHGGSMIAAGTELSDRVFEWAWKDGKENFPENLYHQTSRKNLFIKHLAAQIILRDASDPFSEESSFKDEVKKLSQIKPHAIITTNYDHTLTSIFPDYEEVVGQQIIKSNLDYFGEIFKIHGSVSDPASIIMDEEDYQGYNRKRKYLSAKVLTYLSEHPVFIFGYGVNDPNVVEIIDDVGEVLGSDDQLIPNLFHVSWIEKPDYEGGIAEERLIAGGQGKYRVRSIEADEFSWIFQALSQERELSGLNTKLLRALLSRTYNLIRTDIPRKKFEVNYEMLEHVVSDQEKLPSLIGISKAENSNMTHPYVLSQVGQKLGYAGWHGAEKLLKKVVSETGVDLKKSDNRFHVKIKTGVKSGARKWSDAAVDVLKKVRDGEDYELDM